MDLCIHNYFLNYLKGFTKPSACCGLSCVHKTFLRCYGRIELNILERRKT